MKSPKTSRRLSCGLLKDGAEAALEVARQLLGVLSQRLKFAGGCVNLLLKKKKTNIIRGNPPTNMASELNLCFSFATTSTLEGTHSVGSGPPLGFVRMAPPWKSYFIFLMFKGLRPDTVGKARGPVKELGIKADFDCQESQHKPEKTMRPESLYQSGSQSWHMHGFGMSG